MKSELDISIKLLALKYHGVTKKPLDKCLRWAKRNLKKYLDILYKLPLYKYEKNDEYIAKEFIFRGFVPIDKFKPKKHLDYIISNRKINGVTYIYPIHSSCNYKYLGKYPYTYTLFDSDISVMGYTKILYSKN